MDQSLAVRDRLRTQAELLSQSGLDYALHRIDSRNPGASPPPDFQVEGLKYWVQPARAEFRLDLQPFGLYWKARSEGRVHRGSLPLVTHQTEATASQMLKLSDFPALGLTNKQGNLVLAGSAEIHGPVMLWRGTVRKSTHSKVRFKGSSGHIGATWDSTHSAWKSLSMDLSRVEDWLQRQESYLASGNFSGDKDFPETWASVRLGDSATLVDTLIEDTRMISRGKVRLGRGAVLRNSKLIAEEIETDADARVEKCILYGVRRFSAMGSSFLGGQFLTRDTMLVDVSRDLGSQAAFYVHGRLELGGTRDSLYHGHLEVRNAKGRGVFVFGGWQKPATQQGIHLHVGKAALLEGLVYANGLVHMQGRLSGSLIAENLKFEFKETIWFGHLMDAHISFSKEDRAVPVPLVFPVTIAADWLEKQG